MTERAYMMEYDHKLLTFARELRENMTRQERHLWYDFLRTYPAKLRKQQPIGAYIVDFYCHAAGLVVELDGGQHYEENVIEYDKRRTAFLSSQGLSVLRVTNTDVDHNFSGVYEEIDRAVHALSVGCAASSPRGGATGEKEPPTVGEEALREP